jgi:hypothetical protein
MSASTKFNTEAFLQREVGRPSPAKAANLAKVRSSADPTLATLATLAAPHRAAGDLGSAAWRERYTAKAFEWFRGGRQWSAATRLAWGDLLNEWHALNGKVWPSWQCAGCHKPIGGLAALDLPDGNRVHADDIECLITFGRNWRDSAHARMVEFGLSPPELER